MSERLALDFVDLFSCCARGCVTRPRVLVITCVEEDAFQHGLAIA